MKLKTFLATYLLFLFVMFSSLGIISVYMSNSQMGMIKDKSISEYQTIVASLTKDIAILSGRSRNLPHDINALVNGYAKYYRNNNIDIQLSDISLTLHETDKLTGTNISFISIEREHFMCIAGTLPEPFQNYKLDYYDNITKKIADMQNVQNILLFIGIAFSLITAFALYFILSGIFKPLGIVAKASKKIADGHYNERIRLKGNNEIFAMAEDFNRMAEEIERQIKLLGDEAAAKQHFIDNFAHEIRTPLTSILGYAEYMQKTSLEETEIIESAQFIIDEAAHMKKIANSLLELATLRQYRPNKNKIPLLWMYANICETMKKMLDQQKIQFIYDSEIDVLEGQEDLIKSLLLNLCLNAMKSCPPENGIIHLGAKKQGENIILSVTDNGFGIPEESISKVTEPFYRVDKARSREAGGTGLGLTLCKQIAEVHNAQMIIESGLGIGTTVKILLTTSK